MPKDHVLELLIELFIKQYPDPRAGMIIEMTRFCLENNLMEFNGDFFLQIFGMAMGTPMAVVIANIYMAMLEVLLKEKVH